MKKKTLKPRLSLQKKQILPLHPGAQQQVAGGVNTLAKCPPSVGCTNLQPCITCACPDW